MSDAAPRLARSAGLFGLATMASRVLGLARDQVLAYYFGAGDAMDAFRVAFRIPNLVRDLFAEGAMSAAFVPTFTRELTTGGKGRAFALANSVITALLLITGLLVVLGIVFAEPLVRSYAEDFADVPGKLELTVYLARIMIPFLMLVAVAAVFMGMLNSMGHFFIPALSPAMFNVATIVITVGLMPLSQRWFAVQPIVLVAVATIVGGLGQLLIQWFPLRREAFHYRPSLNLKDPALGRVLMLMGPGTIGMAATQINVLVNTQFAAGEGTGAISWLDYAFRLMYLPIGLFGVSIAAASTPALSRLAAASDTVQMRSTIASAMGLMLALNIPATLGLIVLAEPIIALIFEHGRFTSRDTAATALALQYYAIGLVGYSIVRIVSPAFYALHKSRIPVIASISSVIANVLLNLILVKVMGYAGLALGTSLAAILNATIQFVWLRRELGGIQAGQVAVTFAKVLAAAIPMAAAAWFSQMWLLGFFPGDAIALRALRVLASIVIALAVLSASAWVLRVREFQDAYDVVGRRLGRLRR
ncbi:MAG TPA: murein biosynthesis integral membrane protein MurJ [Vicinamibacterales bacterium]|nr:murein biosynthesis integral membrane protein MurJ [Vicinamibacterales bacterium]